MKRKVLTLVLASVFAASLLIGCGGTSGEEEAPAATDEGASTDGSAVAEETASTFEGFDEMIEIDMYGLCFFQNAGVQEVEDAINAISEEAINVHVNYTQMDIATYSEQMGLMLSGGEKIDLIMDTLIPVVSFPTMQSQNQLMDISEYLPEYAPELLSMMEAYLPATTVDGAVYGVPAYRIYNSNQYFVMRADVLRELGLYEQAEAAKSWTDLENLFIAVKEGQDKLPAEMQTNAILGPTNNVGSIGTPQYLDVTADAFADTKGLDVLGDTTKIIYVDDNGKVGSFFASESFKTGAERMKKWNEEGLIYKDSATTQEVGDSLILNGAVFAVCEQSEVGVEAAKSAACGTEVLCVEVGEIPVQSSNGNAWGWSVPVTSENPEAAVAFLNLLYTNADINNLFVYGIEGRDYELNEAGEAVLLEDKQYQNSDFFVGNQFLVYPAEGTGSDFRTVAMDSLNNATISPYYGFACNTDPISNEITAVSTVLAQYEASIECGDASPETLDEMNAALEAAGLQTMIDYYQEQLDAWLAAK